VALLEICEQPCVQQRRAGRDHEWFVRTFERGADRLDGAQVGFGSAGELAGIGQLVLEGEMDHPIRVGRRGAETIEVVERAAQDLDASGRQGSGGCVGPGEADHGVASGEEIETDGGADVAGGAGDKERMGGFLSTDDIDP